jgi:hypothetical protein
MIMVFIETSIFTSRVKELMKRENKMKQELFEELLESVKEAKAIIKGEKEPLDYPNRNLLRCLALVLAP